MNGAQARVLAVIPARLGSTRLPQKPLRSIAGITLVERVWNSARAAKLVTRLVVATDTDVIADLVKSFGGEVILTDPEISSGSGRVAAVAQQLTAQGPESAFDVVLNIQGDMPFISGVVIDRAIELLLSQPRFDMVTVATPIYDQDVFQSVSDVKVVVSALGEALYFSRAPVPHSRDGVRLQPGADNRSNGAPVFGYKHFGLYVFRPAALEIYRSNTHSALEQVEMLEQLRLVEAGKRIGVLIIEPDLTKTFVEIDTADDVKRAEEILKQPQ